MGERRRWLDRMIDEGFDYIGISPANDRTTQQKEKWLDKVFGYLCGDAGYPEIKTHAFGMTSPRLLCRYPFYSCDSGTWLQAGGHGGILVPKWDRILDDYDYTLFPKAIGMSRSKERGQFGSLGPRKREYVETYLEQEGFELEALKADYLQRQRLCCRFFKKFVARYTRPRFTNRPVTFSRSRSREGVDEDRFGPLRIIFIITTAVGHSDILTDEGMKHRLVTYFDFRDGQNRWFDFRNYVQTGRIVRTKKRKVQT